MPDYAFVCVCVRDEGGELTPESGSGHAFTVNN